MSISPDWWSSTSKQARTRAPDENVRGPFYMAASSGAPPTAGRRFAPSKRFGPWAQNLDAGGIQFRRIDKIKMGAPAGQSRRPPTRLSPPHVKAPSGSHDPEGA